MLKRGILDQSAGIGHPSWAWYCRQIHGPVVREDAVEWTIKKIQEDIKIEEEKRRVE